ncbi:MAG: hypothetical protein AAFR25_12050, partial [Cyanobacteria bacterium J06629_19]
MSQSIDQVLAVAQNPIESAKAGLQSVWDGVKGGLSQAQAVVGPVWQQVKDGAVRAGQAINESVIAPTMAWAQAQQERLQNYVQEKLRVS